MENMRENGELRSFGRLKVVTFGVGQEGIETSLGMALDKKIKIHKKNNNNDNNK